MLLDNYSKYAGDMLSKENKPNCRVKAAAAISRILCGLVSGLPLDDALITELYHMTLSHDDDGRYITECLRNLREKDAYTFNHSANVGLYSFLLSRWMNLPDRDVINASQAGLLHDLGKLKVDRLVLSKNGRLTTDEFEEMKLHTVHGFNLVRGVETIPYEVKKTILMHHEREDGSGYPMQSTSHMIHTYTKIVAITDVFDAMTSDRVYKKGVEPLRAFEMFLTEGINLFDPAILKVFLVGLSKAYDGTGIRLPASYRTA